MPKSLMETYSRDDIVRHLRTLGGRRMSRRNAIKALEKTLVRTRAIYRALGRWPELDEWVDQQWLCHVEEGLVEAVKDLRYWLKKQPVAQPEKRS